MYLGTFFPGLTDRDGGSVTNASPDVFRYLHIIFSLTPVKNIRTIIFYTNVA